MEQLLAEKSTATLAAAAAGLQAKASNTAESSTSTATWRELHA